MSAGEGRYTLQLDEGEVERYRMMAEQARAAEADLWELAGSCRGPGWRTSAAGPVLPTFFARFVTAVGRRPA